MSVLRTLIVIGAILTLAVSFFFFYQTTVGIMERFSRIGNIETGLVNLVGFKYLLIFGIISGTSWLLLYLTDKLENI